MKSKKLISKCFPTLLLLLIGTIFGKPSTGFSQGGILIDNGAKLVVEGNASIVILDGMWQNDGVFVAGSGLVRIEGNASTVNSTIGGVSTNGDFYNLTLDKASNAASLVNDIVVDNQLTLINAPLDLNTHSLILSNGDSNAVVRNTGYLLSEQPNNSSTVAWIIGTNTAEHIFPFGAVSGEYIPVKIRVTAGNSDTVRVSTYPTNVANLPLPLTPTLVTNIFNADGLDNSAFTVDRFWEINPSGATAEITLTLTAQISEVGSITNLTAQRWDSLTKTWDAPLLGQTNSSVNVTVPNVSAFTTFALTQDIEPLRVEFLSFDAYANGSKVVLKWATGSEFNSDYFSVQRSADGYSFTEVTTKPAAGNSNQLLKYAAEDLHPLQGRSFYRIVEYGLDGNTIKTDMRAVFFETSKSMSYSLYPNPATQGNLQLRIVGGDGENVTIRLADVLGRVLMVKALTIDSDIMVYSFEILPMLANGNYIVWITSKEGNQSFRVVVQ